MNLSQRLAEFQFQAILQAIGKRKASNILFLNVSLVWYFLHILLSDLFDIKYDTNWSNSDFVGTWYHDLHGQSAVWGHVKFHHQHTSVISSKA